MNIADGKYKLCFISQRFDGKAYSIVSNALIYTQFVKDV